MRIQIKGRTIGTFPSIRLGKAIMTLPNEIKCNQDEILGKEIVFPCNIHDMESQGDSAVVNIVISDSIDLDPSRLTALYFAVPQNTERFVITEINAFTKIGISYNLTDITVSFVPFVGNKIDWTVGEKNITLPSLHKIKQSLIKKEPPMEKERTNVVENSEPVSLNTIISAYQNELAKGNDYEKE